MKCWDCQQPAPGGVCMRSHPGLRSRRFYRENVKDFYPPREVRVLGSLEAHLENIRNMGVPGTVTLTGRKRRRWEDERERHSCAGCKRWRIVFEGLCNECAFEDLEATG